mgnify:CR=1 FL=1
MSKFSFWFILSLMLIASSALGALGGIIAGDAVLHIFADVAGGKQIKSGDFAVALFFFPGIGLIISLFPAVWSCKLRGAANPGALSGAVSFALHCAAFLFFTTVSRL